MKKYMKILVNSGLLMGCVCISTLAWGQEGTDLPQSLSNESKRSHVVKKSKAEEEKDAPHYRADSWQGKSSAVVMVLNRIDSHTQQLSIPVGNTQEYETLKIEVKSCVVRPPGVSADSAAFLSIVDAHPTSKPFNAWMFEQEPALSVYENPVYNVQLVKCEGQNVGAAPEVAAPHAETSPNDGKKPPSSSTGGSSGAADTSTAPHEQEPSAENPVPDSP